MTPVTQSGCMQKKQLVHPEQRQKDFYGQPNLKWGSTACIQNHHTIRVAMDVKIADPKNLKNAKNAFLMKKIRNVKKR